MFILTLKYSIFAGIAILVNIGTQYLILKIYNGKFNLYLAIASGTLTGLIVKYYLDKLYIFYHSTKNIKEDTQKFLLYSLMGLFTTLIFWGFEFGFHFFWDSENAKFIGGAIGLVIGYLIKYQLDKKFVFTRQMDHKNLEGTI